MARPAIFLLIALSFVAAGTSLARATEDEHGSVGFIDPSGKVVIPPTFDFGLDFSGGLAAVRRKGKWGYVDRDGRPCVNFRFNFAESFSEGFAAVAMQRGDQLQWGYISPRGQLMIEAHFLCAGSFSEGLAPVLVEKHDRRHEDARWGYINTQGKFVILPRYSAARPFAHGRAVVQIGERWAIISRSGRTVSDHVISASGFKFCDGLLRVRVDSKWGYIDPEGKFAIPPHFEAAYDASEGLAVVRSKGRFGALDSRGAVAIEPTFDSLVISFRKGVIGAKGKRWHLLDSSGESIAVLPHNMQVWGELRDDRMLVRRGERFGYINAAGELAIPPTLPEAGDFSEQRAIFSSKRNALTTTIAPLDENIDQRSR